MFLLDKSYYAIKKSKNKGRGIFAKKDIQAGTIIGDYIGKIVRPKDENEKRDGLYTMSGGARYDLLANPKDDGIHLINHSCENNSVIYPYRGHILFVALRKIFKGEEISIDYMLGKADSEDKMTCADHACHCGSGFCTGTMHNAEEAFSDWQKLLKKQFGEAYNQLPGKYGNTLPALSVYPTIINQDHPKIYNIFGSEKKSPQYYTDKIIPTITEIRERIRQTGRRISLPKLHLTIDGIKNGFLFIRCF